MWTNEQLKCERCCDYCFDFSHKQKRRCAEAWDWVGLHCGNCNWNGWSFSALAKAMMPSLPFIVWDMNISFWFESLNHRHFMWLRFRTLMPMPNLGKPLTPVTFCLIDFILRYLSLLIINVSKYRNEFIVCLQSKPNSYTSTPSWIIHRFVASRLAHFCSTNDIKYASIRIIFTSNSTRILNFFFNPRWSC